MRLVRVQTRFHLSLIRQMSAAFERVLRLIGTHRSPSGLLFQGAVALRAARSQGAPVRTQSLQRCVSSKPYKLYARNLLEGESQIIVTTFKLATS